ncbi:MAG: hypothetical protein ACOC5J_00130 [Gemmatimonadota bacterium]
MREMMRNMMKVRNLRREVLRSHRRGQRRRALIPVLGFLALLGVSPSSAMAQAPHDHEAGHAHGANHASTTVPLEETGNAAFAAIQEVVAELNAREDTDWSRVDLEALRQHLLDMRRFTVDAEVVEREEIDGGLRVAVRGPDAETHRSLRSSLEGHAPMLEQEMGWTVSVTEGEGRIVLEATADTPEEAERIRGLGYIGLMVSGAHHREHHWQIATGQQPHGHDH